MHRLVLVIIISALVVAGCSKQQQSALRVGKQPPPVQVKSQPAHQASDSQEEQRTPSVPSDVKYSIIDSDTIPGIKRTLSIRLNKKVSEDVLREIALKLKSEDSSEYDRTLITYILPGMTVGTGAWATTHFDPDLQVCILGLTAEQEQLLKAKRQPSSRKVIGKWVDNGVGGSSIMTIFREHGKYCLESRYSDGSVGMQILIKSGAYRFNDFESDAGDHYVILSDGDLEISDNDGLIATCTKTD